MTELSYLTDSYVKEFDAIVKEVKGKFIIFDKTAFYPQGGGQPCDTGELVTQNGDKFKILFVKKMGDEISHEVDAEGLRSGEIVHCTLNWDNRYRYMRSHTAAHILAAVIHKATGAKITGNQISMDKIRIDFNLEKFDREALILYARDANEIIGQNLQIDVREMPREEAFKIPDVIKLKDILPPSIETIRVITIPDVDQQACGGTHVSNTREIGPIEIVKAENKGANNRRVYFILKN